MVTKAEEQEAAEGGQRAEKQDEAGDEYLSEKGKLEKWKGGVINWRKGGVINGHN